MTPVPKPKRMEDVETCKDLRKIASTSDSAKIFESFLRDWITQDIGDKLDINQFAGKTGVGTEHRIVWMMDRVQKLLDKPGMLAVVLASVDWSDAFSRTDPTKTIQKLISLGLRSSLIPIIIEFLQDRVMSLKFNGEESPLFTLIGGGPQGSWNGQNCYLTASNDNTDFVNQEDRFKYCVDCVFQIRPKNDVLRSQNKWKQICRYMDKSQLAIYLCLSTLRNAIDKQSTITSHK